MSANTPSHGYARSHGSDLAHVCCVDVRGIAAELESLRAALREAEAQRDEAREGAAHNARLAIADAERADAAERKVDALKEKWERWCQLQDETWAGWRRKVDSAEAQLKLRTGVFMTWMAKASQDVDEYRQALQPFAGGGHAYGYDDCKWCVAAKVLAVERGQSKPDPAE